MGRKRAVSPELFNYGLFQADIMNKCRESGITLSDVSEKKLYRDKSYLRSRLCEKALPLNIIFALCDYFDLSAREYEIRREKPEIAQPQTSASAASYEVPTVCDGKPLVFNVVSGGKIYTCETKVCSDIKTIVSTLHHDGDVICCGRGNFHGESVGSILRSISYGIYSLGIEIGKMDENNK